MKDRFSEKTALVIGATGGIGSEVSKIISEEQGKLILFSRNEQKLNELKNNLGGDHLTVVGNAVNSEDIENAVSKGLEKFDKIDVLIHCVGSIVLKSLQTLSADQLRETIELNLISPFLAMKAVVPHMTKNKNGSVVAVSSVAGSVGLFNHEGISAAKGGLESLIRSAAITYAKKGIRFNGVSLGLVETPLSEFLTKSEISMKASLGLHPLGRLGKAIEAAKAIVYLASEDAAWVTGTIMPVDGGLSAGKTA